MQEKINILDRASKAYYAEGTEIMTNFEYDRIYDELAELEAESGIILSGSPTQKVGYEVLSELPKERHTSRMLSLDKTKSRDELLGWLGDKKGLLSWKLDGLTIVLTYSGGGLTKAVTRGNGDVGEVITGNARVFVNVPLRIGYKGDLVLRGEAVITYHDFEEINGRISEADQRYKNPRNLCAGSVRQLDPRVTAKRRVRFYAFALVSADSVDFHESREEQMKWLAAQGFDCVRSVSVTGDTLFTEIQSYQDAIGDNPVPSDGLVLTYDDLVYSASLGSTAKYPRDSIAFKWMDQTADTTLTEIEWSASRTGLINPIAVFDPVELEGTTVSRASLHNISIAEELGLGIGDTVRVYKANMIIPQISEDLTPTHRLPIPDRCPACKGEAVIRDDNGVRTLYCPNPNCLAKQIKSFTLFVSRDAMNIEGLSELTIEKLVGRGLIREPADFFHIEKYHDEITEMEGFGEKSFERLKASVEKARDTDPERLLYSLGIPGIGVANAKVIARACKEKWADIESLSTDRLKAIDGVGDIMASQYAAFFADPEKRRIVADILAEVRLDESYEEGGTFFDGMTFVITGSLNGYANREELKYLIESSGGRVAGSVSAKTTYLINNDVSSASGKNKKAKELGIPIIDERTVTDWLAKGGVS